MKLRADAQGCFRTACATCPYIFLQTGEFENGLLGPKNLRRGASWLHPELVDTLLSTLEETVAIVWLRGAAIRGVACFRSSNIIHTTANISLVAPHQRLITYNCTFAAGDCCSKSMTRNCSTSVAEHGIMAGFVDLGIGEGDAHTGLSKDPAMTANNAFIDFLSLMDASVVIRTGSSFSGTVVNIKGLKCENARSTAKARPRLVICLPIDC